MANSLLSIKQNEVSYLEVYQIWIRNNQHRNNGQCTIPIIEIVRYLRSSMLLKKPEYQEVYHEKTDVNKLLKLFNDYMPGKGEEGFKQVLDCLYQNTYIGLAKDLEAQMQKCLSFQRGMMSEQNQAAADDVHKTTSNQMPIHSPIRKYVPMKVENPLMMEAQEYLSRLFTDNVVCMAKFWSGLIHPPKICDSFAEVQVLEESGKVVRKYEEIFENVSKTQFKRIVIQGDPGYGKSTYVDKIALEWAKQHEYLRHKFDLVFLIAFKTLNMSIEKAIQLLLPERSIKYVEDYYKGPSSKVLLILDGFDEFPEDSQFYSDVMKMLKGQMRQFQFFTIIVTTKRSHVGKVPQLYRKRSLLIKGFNEQSMKLFLQRQQVPVPDEQTGTNLLVLLQNPLFCAIYCSLHFGGVDKSKLEDPYDFIKALVENAEKNEERTISDEFRFSCYCKFNIEIPTINDITSLKFPYKLNEIIHDSRFFSTLAKCINLKILDFTKCHVSTNETNELVKVFKENRLPRLTQLGLCWLSIINPTPDLFTALDNYEHLETLKLSGASLSIASINRLATCIENNSWPNLDTLKLDCNKNVGQAIKLFRVLYKCLHIRKLDLSTCSMTNQSMNTFLSTVKSNTFQNLQNLYLGGNGELEIADNFYLSLVSCSKLSSIRFHVCGVRPIEHQLSSSAQEAKEALLDRGCNID